MGEWSQIEAKIGRALKAALQSRGISNAAAAEMVGVHQTTVSRWTNGEALPEWPNLWQLSRATGISPAEIMGPMLAGPWGARADVAEALAADDRLTDSQRQAIFGVYLSHVES